MTSLTAADMASRTGPMAKNWIQKAVPESHKGVFKKKAQAAGKTTKEFAEEHKHDSGKLGSEARFAENVMGLNKGKKKRSPLYDHPKSKKED